MHVPVFQLHQLDFIIELCISTELSLLMLKSLEEADNNVPGFSAMSENKRGHHSLLSAIRQQITNVIPLTKTVN